MRISDKSQTQLPPMPQKKKNKSTNQKQEQLQELTMRKTLVDFLIESKLNKKGLHFQAKDGNTGIIPGSGAIVAAKGTDGGLVDTENTTKIQAGKPSYVYEDGMFYIKNSDRLSIDTKS